MLNASSGILFTRGKQNRYYLQYYVNGKKISVALKDVDGKPITDRKKAEIAKAELLTPLMASNNVDRLRKIRDAVEDAEIKAERLNKENENKKQKAAMDAVNKKATFEHGWQLFMTCPKRPASCKRYPADNLPKHTHQSNYKYYYDAFARWCIQKDKEYLFEVTMDDASLYMDEIRSSKASGTFNKYLQFYKMFYNVLIKSGKLNATNPFSDIETVERRYNSKKPLTIEQIRTLLKNTSGDFKLLIAIGYFTGLRFGDCCTLLWDEIDMDRQIVERIPRKIANTVKDQSQAVVKIGLPADLLVLLSDIPKENRHGYVFPDFAKNYLAGKSSNISQKVLRLFQRSGIRLHKEETGQNGRAIPENGFHSLRYSYISHNAEAGTPAAVIQKNAGHANPAMTEHYTKISDAAAVKYASALTLQDKGNNSTDVRDELLKIVKSLSTDDILRLLEHIKQNF